MRRSALAAIRRPLPRLLAVAAPLIAFVIAVTGTGASPAAAYPAGVTIPGSARLSGVALQTFYDASPQVNFAKISSDGSNMFNITVWWQVPCTNGSNNDSCTTSTSDSVEPCPPSGSAVAGFPSTCSTGETIGDEQLITLAEQAENAGLKVSITPDFTVGDSGWRGGYDPGQTSGGQAAFFSSYQRMVDHYATIAQQVHASMFWVGSEMTDSEQYTSDWESLISSVRQLYTGQVLYDVNWNILTQVKFYSALDAMSISAYFPLSNDPDPSLAQLEAAWGGANPQNQNWAAEIAHAQATWQEPVYFGEVGYSADTYAAQAPYSEPASGSSDPQLQYRCYQALLDTFRGDPWWGGVVWWSWEGGVYNMVGQPAESLIGTSSVGYPQAGSQAGSGSSGSSTGSPSGTSGSSSSPTGSKTIAGGSSSGGTFSSGSRSIAAGGKTKTGGTQSSGAATGTSPSNATSGVPGATGPGGTDATGGGIAVTHRSSGGIGTPLIAAGIAVLLLVLGGIVLVKRGVFRRPAPQEPDNPQNVVPPFDGTETMSITSGTKSTT